MLEGPMQSIGRFFGSPAFKLALIAVLVLMLAIPLFSVWALVAERENRSHEVGNEVARSWGGPQAVVGPFLIVPYTTTVRVEAGGKQVEQTQDRVAVFMPDTLDIKAKTASQLLHRSIYQVPVYSGELALAGRFEAPDMGKVTADAIVVHWSEVTLALGLTDVSGLKQASALKIDGRGDLGFEPSVGVAASSMNGIHARIADAKAASAPTPALDFAFTLAFSGSYSLTFAPVARETAVSLASDWSSPSFSGAFLPVERKIGKDGFTAAWKVPHLARSVPQAWSMAEQDFSLARLDGYVFGADLYVPVDFYDLVSRALKYGLMFPAVSFMAVFILELLTRQRLHPVQYVFTGAALVLFFVLLLSLAEHTGFAAAYVLAALATSLLVAAYVARAMASATKGGIMLGLLLLLYVLVYLILRLEDYALLAGALAGFVLLAAAMFLTLGVDWSGTGKPATGDVNTTG